MPRWIPESSRSPIRGPGRPKRGDSSPSGERSADGRNGTPKPLILRFLPGDIPMLAGEARHIASDRAGFLGSHPLGRPPEKRQR